jgi:phosphoserine phosphatase
MKRAIRLVIFDLDGTLTPVDSLWRFLHDEFGTWEQGRVASQRYRRGEITYKEWAETDAGYWTGAAVSTVMNALEKIQYREGVREVFSALKRKGVKIAIVSAGLSLLADKVAEELGADLVLSNELETNDGRLTGRITVRVPVNDKARIIEQIAEQLNVPIAETALVGDRAYDISNSKCLRIAYKPKDELARREADFVVEDDDLVRILQYIV